jgi:hypothetical protein
MAGASLTLNLIANIPDERLAQLTRDLERDLSRTGVQARPVEAPPAEREKGEPITLGVLVLALITSGAITAVIECFKAYLSRERTLTIRLMRADGTQIEVTGRNVDAPAVRATLEAAALPRG